MRVVAVEQAPAAGTQAGDDPGFVADQIFHGLVGSEVLGGDARNDAVVGAYIEGTILPDIPGGNRDLDDGDINAPWQGGERPQYRDLLVGTAQVGMRVYLFADQVEELVLESGLAVRAGHQHTGTVELEAGAGGHVLQGLVRIGDFQQRAAITTDAALAHQCRDRAASERPVDGDFSSIIGRPVQLATDEQVSWADVGQIEIDAGDFQAVFRKAAPPASGDAFHLA